MHDTIASARGFPLPSDHAPPAAVTAREPATTSAHTNPSAKDDRRVPRTLDAAAAWSWRVLVILAAVVAVVYGLVQLRFLVLPLFGALLLTALLRPLTMRLRDAGLPRSAATAVTLLVAVAVLGAFATLISRQTASEYDELEAQVRGGAAEVRDYLTGSPFNLDPEQLNSIGDRLVEAGRTNQAQLTEGAVTGATIAFEIAAGTVLALFATIFFLYDGDRIWRWVVRLFPRGGRPRVEESGRRAWTTMAGYIRGTVIVAFVDAFFIGLGLLLVGVPLALPLAVITFLAAFVPLVGATVAGILAVLVALVANGVTAALIIAAVVIAVQQLEGHVLQPFVLGRSVSLHPLAIVLAIGAGSILAGIPGAVIAVPLVATVNSVASYLFSSPEEQATSRPASAVAAADGT
jgi:predicted PurR-regulated permease PerM